MACPFRSLSQKGQQQDKSRRHGKAKPRREAAKEAVAMQYTKRKANLARGWARQELTERHEIDVARLVDPLATHHQLVAKITKVRDWAAE
jgi:hypothetical protein